MRKRKQRDYKTLERIIDLILWVVLLGFGAYLGVKLILGFILYNDDMIFYYGFALCGYVAALLLVIICWTFVQMIVKEFKSGDEEE